MIYLCVGFYLLASVVAGIGEGLRIKDVSKYSTAWHWLQWFERMLIFVSGFATVYLGDYVLIVSMSLLFAVMFFVIYDGCINLILRRNFFYVSETSTAFTERFAHWWIKIPLIIIVFIFNALILRKK